MRDEYAMLQGYKPREAAGQRGARGAAAAGGGEGERRAAAAVADSKSNTAKLIDLIPAQPPAATRAAAAKGKELVLHGGEGAPGVGPGAITPAARAALSGAVMIPTAAGGEKEYVPSAAISRRLASKWPRPAWHAPWRNYRVISGHLGCAPSACVCSCARGDPPWGWVLHHRCCRRRGTVCCCCCCCCCRMQTSGPAAAALRRRGGAGRLPPPSPQPPTAAAAPFRPSRSWVRSVAFEPGNEWFVTGSADRTIKVRGGEGGWAAVLGRGAGRRPACAAGGPVARPALGSLPVAPLGRAPPPWYRCGTRPAGSCG